MVKAWTEHKAWVVKSCMQRGGMHGLVYGSAKGEVKLWDIYMDNPVRGFQACTMRTLGVREHVPIIATCEIPHFALYLYFYKC